MTIEEAKAIVLKEHPTASSNTTVVGYPPQWIRASGTDILGVGWSERRAWEEAAERIQKEQGKGNS